MASLRVLILSIFILFSVLNSAEFQIIDYLRGAYPGQRFGDACEGLGDINSDGYSDFLVAEFMDEKLHLFLGGPAPFDNSPVLTWENHEGPIGLQSFPPKNVGDVDGDGVDDFLAVFARNDSLKLFIGMENLDPDDYLLFLDTNNNCDDFRFSGGGDNNADGNPDFWIFKSCGPLYDTIWGYSGGVLLDTIADFKIVRSRMPDNKYMVLGLELCSTCDINGDSIPEIIYSQPSSDPNYPGRICIIWGGENLSESPDFILNPVSHLADYQFGMDLACLGDISGDDIDDIWISQEGRNYIYFGCEPFDTIPDLVIDWSYARHDIVENIGDINNDGYCDVLITDDSEIGSRVSYIYCYPGMDSLIDASYNGDVFGINSTGGAVCCLGISHGKAGDINGDGIDDVLISARTTGNDNLDYGWIFIQSGWQEPVSTDDEQDNLPQIFSLAQNYPNPFNSGTTISFTLSRGGYTEVVIYNILGEIVATPLAKQLPAGEHRIQLDGKDTAGNATATGVYFYRITSGDFTEMKKMMLLK